jgi:hypothetical protein
MCSSRIARARGVPSREAALTFSWLSRALRERKEGKGLTPGVYGGGGGRGGTQPRSRNRSFHGSLWSKYRARDAWSSFTPHKLWDSTHAKASSVGANSVTAASLLLR